MINQSGTVEETNHYYPFGGVFGTTGNTQPYKYNGKELDTKQGLTGMIMGRDIMMLRWEGLRRMTRWQRNIIR